MIRHTLIALALLMAVALLAWWFVRTGDPVAEAHDACATLMIANQIDEWINYAGESGLDADMLREAWALAFDEQTPQAQNCIFAIAEAVRGN